jgi:hypothetical protein
MVEKGLHCFLARLGYSQAESVETRLDLDRKWLGCKSNLKTLPTGLIDPLRTLIQAVVRDREHHSNPIAVNTRFQSRHRTVFAVSTFADDEKWHSEGLV